MDDFERHDEIIDNSSTLTLLEAFLDYHRATILQKVTGLSETDVRKSPLAALITSPMPMTLPGLVKHLAYVERNWFESILMGVTDLPVPWTDEDPDADFRFEPTETIEEVVDFYKHQVRKSRHIVRQIVEEAGSEDAALSVRAKHPSRTPTLRWILVHMIEETARHNGHADLIRELTDGATGE